MTESLKLIIVMGAERSGTTWLQSILSTHPAVSTRSELFLYFYTYGWLQTWERHQRTHEEGVGIGLPAIWDRETMLRQLREMVDSVYADVASSNPQATVIVDKTPAYTHRVDHIHELRPDAHFIHIIRDGRDVVSSILAASRSWGRRWATGDAQKAAKKWVQSVQAGQTAQQYAGQYSEIRYEALLEDGENVIRQIMKDVGLPADEETIQRILANNQFQTMRNRDETNDQRGLFELKQGFLRKGKSGSWATDLTLSERWLVYKKAQSLLRELGYVQDESWWYESPHQRLTIPLVTSTRRQLGRMRRYLNRASAGQAD